MVWRIGISAAVLTRETLLLSFLVQMTPIDWVTGPARVVRDVQHWFFRFIIVYSVCLIMLGYLGCAGTPSPRPGAPLYSPWRGRWAAAHVLLLLPLTILSGALYSGSL